MRGYVCECHTHRSKVPLETHHVWPLGYHGPDTTANKAIICSNAHSDVHYYMNYMFKNNGKTPPDYKTYGPKVIKLAREGYEQVMAYCESIKG